MTKKEARQKYLALRREIPPVRRAEMAVRICDRLEEFLVQTEPSGVHCFSPILEKGEVDVSPIFTWCFRAGIPVHVPKMDGDILRSVEISPNTRWIKNSWGIAEPEERGVVVPTPISHVITPLVYADFNGNRVGYGKGYYDRFFASLPNPVLKIGVNYFPPAAYLTDVQATDVPLDYLVLPEEMLSFSLVG